MTTGTRVAEFQRRRFAGAGIGLLATTQRRISIGYSKASSYNVTNNPQVVGLTQFPSVGDVVVVALSGAASGVVMTPPSAGITGAWLSVLGGSTLVDSDAHQVIMLYHIVTAADDFTKFGCLISTLFSTTPTGQIACLFLSGVDTASPLCGTGSTFSSTDAATPWNLAGVTPTADNCMVVSAVAGDGSETISVQPTGWTSRIAQTSSPTLHIYTRDTLGVNASPIAATALTPSGGDEYASITACFKPIP